MSKTFTKKEISDFKNRSMSDAIIQALSRTPEEDVKHRLLRDYVREQEIKRDRIYLIVVFAIMVGIPMIALFL